MNKQAKIVIGSILGDGSLSPLAKRKPTSTIDISQCFEKLSYLRWLYTELGKEFKLNPILKKKGFNVYRFSSKSNEILGEFRSLFYSESKKIIPMNIKDLLKDPTSLAIWYMDDGTLDNRSKYHFNASIATYCFTFEECNYLTELLKDNFGLHASVNKSTMRGIAYPRIHILSKSMNDFISIVRPYIHPTFNYKIGE